MVLESGSSYRGKIPKILANEGLFKHVAKTVSLLRANPRHPRLNTHEYDSIENPFDKQKKVFAAYAQNQRLWSHSPQHIS